MATLTVAESVERMFAMADKRLKTEWGAGLDYLGTRIQRALYAEELLRILAMQDNSDVSDNKVRVLLEEAYAQNLEA